MMKAISIYYQVIYASIPNWTNNFFQVYPISFLLFDIHFFLKKSLNINSLNTFINRMHCQQYANVKFSSNWSCRELGTVAHLKVLDRAYSTDSIGHTCCT